MWSDYFFYLMGLPENKRNVKILVIVGFWIIINFSNCGLLDYNVNNRIFI